LNARLYLLHTPPYQLHPLATLQEQATRNLSDDPFLARLLHDFPFSVKPVLKRFRAFSADEKQ
jgi:hypothetical protein